MPSKRNLLQGLKFLAVGGGAAISYVLISTFLIAAFANIPEKIISAASYAAFIFPVYILQRNFTFESDVNHRQALPRYLAIQALSLALNYFLAQILYENLHLPHFIIQSILIGATSVLSFVALKLWAFAEKKK